jgi:hypothetical protein
VKVVLGFDPGDHDYGPASSAIRSILGRWTSIDWFEPTGTTDEEGARLFREHNALGRAHAPELFSETIDVRFASGRWPEFGTWTQRVRPPASWDWKYSVLKVLSRKHASAHGWTLEQAAVGIPIGPPRTGALFMRMGPELVIWSGGLASLPGLTDDSSFYFHHAHADVLDCMQWQFAAKQNALDGNPFWPLLDCYRAGLYPFSLDRDTVVLFRFMADASTLPRARVVT